MKYGRSLSICGKDILDGKIKKEDVGKIVTSTCALDNNDWLKILSDYSQSYWRDYTLSICKELLFWLIENDKIYQPRINQNKYQDLGHHPEVWVNSYVDAIKWLKY